MPYWSEYKTNPPLFKTRTVEEECLKAKSSSIKKIVFFEIMIVKRQEMEKKKCLVVFYLFFVKYVIFSMLFT